MIQSGVQSTNDNHWNWLVIMWSEMRPLLQSHQTGAMEIEEVHSNSIFCWGVRFFVGLLWWVGESILTIPLVVLRSPNNRPVTTATRKSRKKWNKTTPQRDENEESHSDDDDIHLGQSKSRQQRNKSKRLQQQWRRFSERGRRWKQNKTKIRRVEKLKRNRNRGSTTSSKLARKATDKKKHGKNSVQAKGERLVSKRTENDQLLGYDHRKSEP